MLDIDSSVNETYGRQEGSVYNGHFGCTCNLLLFCFNQIGDIEGAMLWEGNVQSAKNWKTGLERIIGRCRDSDVVLLFRGDAAFADPCIHECLELDRYRYAIRLPANDAFWREIEQLLVRPAGRPPKAPIVRYHDVKYQGAGCSQARRKVAEMERYRGELFPRVGSIVTNLTMRAKNVVHFYNQRRTVEQWIKERKNTVKWTRIYCYDFADNAVRRLPLALAYNLGNFLRQLALPKPIRHWTMTTLRNKLIKIGAKVVSHARYTVFQMAEVAVPQALLRAILGRIDQIGEAVASTA